MLRSWPTASAPSASIHPPPALIPTSRRIVATGTPVHSAQLVKPWDPCTVGPSTLPVHSVNELPEHSRKWMRETDGEALQVVHGEERRPLDQAVDQQPVLARVDGRDAAVVDLVEEAFGVMVPCRSASGEKLTSGAGDKRTTVPRRARARHSPRTGAGFFIQAGTRGAGWPGGGRRREWRLGASAAAVRTRRVRTGRWRIQRHRRPTPPGG